MKQESNTNKQRVAVFPETPKKRKNRGLWIFLGLLVVFGLFGLLMNMDNGAEDEFGYVEGMPYVAVMYIEGEISDDNYDTLGYPYGYQHCWTLDQLDELAYDPDNRGVFFYVDSPGGTIYHSDELYLAIKEYSEMTGRPVYVYMGPYGASGAYYAATAADKIFANRNTWTGSIGVTIGTLFDASELLDKAGIEAHTIDTGDMKSAGNTWDELTDEQLAYFQDLVDEAFDQFTGIVAEERSLKIENVKAIADGRIYTAKQAKELMLIDEIGSMDDAITDMCKVYNLWDCDFVDVDYDYEDSGLGFGDLLYFLMGKTDAEDGVASAKLKAQAEAKLELTDPLSYLYTGLGE